MKLSELLSYLLYESAQKSVSLDKELSAINSFILLSESRGRFDDLSINITGDTGGLYLPPNLLIHFIQNCFQQIFRGMEICPVAEIEISTEDDLLSVILSISSSMGDLSRNDWNSLIHSEQKRLNLLFPQNDCVLTISNRYEILEIQLVLKLLKMESTIPKRNLLKGKA